MVGNFRRLFGADQRARGSLLGRLRDQVIASGSGSNNVAAMTADLSLEEQNRVFLYTLNFGWMGVFRFWFRQPIFQQAWQRASFSYNELFQQFYDSTADTRLLPPSVSAR